MWLALAASRASKVSRLGFNERDLGVAPALSAINDLL